MPSLETYLPLVGQKLALLNSGLGGALSAAVAGFIMVKAGYSAAFLFLATVAAAGLALFTALMPETGPQAAPFPLATMRFPAYAGVANPPARGRSHPGERHNACLSYSWIILWIVLSNILGSSHPALQPRS
jgi:hypothetical protein